MSRAAQQARRAQLRDAPTEIVFVDERLAVARMPARQTPRVRVHVDRRLTAAETLVELRRAVDLLEREHGWGD